MTYTERARQLRPYIEKAAVSLPDSDAVKAVELFPAWTAGADYAVGVRVRDGGVLYKCRQAHTSQAGWSPAETPALWTAVDASHSGTQDDPIPAVRGMEYTYGLYYRDPEDNGLYLCGRTGESTGGTVVLQYLPHELVGVYFTKIE